MLSLDKHLLTLIGQYLTYSWGKNWEEKNKIRQHLCSIKIYIFTIYIIFKFIYWISFIAKLKPQLSWAIAKLSSDFNSTSVWSWISIIFVLSTTHPPPTHPPTHPSGQVVTSTQLQFEAELALFLFYPPPTHPDKKWLQLKLQLGPCSAVALLAGSYFSE